MMKLHNVGGTTPMLDGTRMVDLLTRLKNLPWANGDDHETRVGEILDEYGVTIPINPMVLKTSLTMKYLHDGVLST